MEDVLEVYHRPHDPDRPVVCRKRCSATLGRFSANQGGCWGAQHHGISSSIRFCGQPFTKRVSKSVKYACGLTPLSLVAVGTRITARPPHRTVRAAFPHTAPTLGV